MYCTYNAYCPFCLYNLFLYLNIVYCFASLIFSLSNSDFDLSQGLLEERRSSMAAVAKEKDKDKDHLVVSSISHVLSSLDMF